MLKSSLQTILNRENHSSRKSVAFIIGLIFVVIVIGGGAWLYWEPIYNYIKNRCDLLINKEDFRQYIQSYGSWASLVFIFFQISQVFIAPIPGELVSIVGGYIFGWLPSLIYSTVGLTLGSLVNFGVARVIGRSFVERVTPSRYIYKFSFLMKRQGVLLSFIFFALPGFPKDVFCYFLGLAPISWRMFILVCSIGRIPGTVILSIQGALVYQEDYWSIVYFIIFTLIFVIPVYIWRERVYQFLYRLDKR